MTPQELKDSIIQLALQGKIVEHVPEDGTGEEALEKAIRTVHSVRAPFSNDDYTLDLPESWTWAKLSEITSDESLNDGNWVLSKDMATTGPVKLIQLGSIGNCKYKDKGFKYLTEEHFRELNGRQIYSGYLLVNRLIGDRMLACILPTIDGILMTAVDVCWIAPNENIYDLQYLMYALTSSDFQSKVKSLGRGTTRFRISKLNLIDIAFPFPPLAEQKRIVAKIEELLPLIERYEKAWGRLEDFNKRFPDDMQKSILQMAIQGKLVEQRPEEGTGEELYNQIQAEKQALIKAGKIKKEKPLSEITEDEMPFDIPESWRWVRFSDIATFENGDRSSKYPVEADYVEHGVPFFGAKDMGKKYMSFSEVRYISLEKYNELGNGKLRDKDFICLLRGSVGKCAIFNADDKHKTGFICAQMIIIRCLTTSLCEYVFTYLSSTYYAKSIESKVTGTAVRQLPGKELGKLLIPLPPLAEQKRIVARLEELLPLCEKLK